MNDATTKPTVQDRVIEALEAVGPFYESSAEIDDTAYVRAHDLFRTPVFSGLGLADLSNDHVLYQRYDAVRRHDLKTMEQLRKRRLIVSFTSYPARIGTVARMLDTLYAQTKKPDAIVLWLSKEQFPQREGELPSELNSLVTQGRLDIRWCEGDLKSHKKYFYALQEFCDDVVAVFDDDLRYDPMTLECLWHSYLQFPTMVSAARAHLIVFSPTGEVLPYACWFKEVETMAHTPSLHLFATSGAGSVYPPHVMPQETFDEDAITRLCLHADDIWLKAMQVRAQVPVVVAKHRCPLSLVPGTQQEGLFQKNVDQCGNDRQLHAVIAELTARLGDDWFAQTILHGTAGEPLDNTLEGYALLAEQRYRDQRECYMRVRRERGAAREQLDESRRQVEHLRADLDAVREQLDESNRQVELLHNELDALRTSKAFRVGNMVAAPYRKLADRMRDRHA